MSLPGFVREATLDALPLFVHAVRRRLIVLFDSGIRGGADVVKAIAFGASAVLLGRSYIWGLVLAGEDGVREVVSNLLGQLENTLVLSGHASVAEVSRASLVWWGMQRTRP